LGKLWKNKNWESCFGTDETLGTAVPNCSGTSLMLKLQKGYLGCFQSPADVVKISKIRYSYSMIGRLRGELIQKTTGSALVDCCGVGYICSISLTTYGLLPDEGCEVILYSETLLRENDLSLLGFASTKERGLYRLLVKVDGIGPKLALAALGAVSIEDLIGAIRGRDIKTLTRIPGVGKKTAEKICFELSEKLGGLTGLDGLSGDALPVNSWESDLRSALTNLGFKEDAVIPLVAQFKQDRPPLSDAIRICLKALQR
jgi:Holliday junction DNA helicase RuvA